MKLYLPVKGQSDAMVKYATAILLGTASTEATTLTSTTCQSHTG
jgi:hypothetical protein